MNGLHRGAVLPLAGDSVTIGCSEDADMVMVDNAIEAEHAVLRFNGVDWVLLAEQGRIAGVGQTSASDSVELVPDQPVLLGDSGIWLVLSSAEAAWIAPPAGHPGLAAAQPEARVEPQPAYGSDAGFSGASDAGFYGGSDADFNPRAEPGFSDDPVVLPPPAPGGSAGAPPNLPTPRRRSRWLPRRLSLGLVLALTAIVCSTAYALVQRDETPPRRRPLTLDLASTPRAARAAASASAAAAVASTSVAAAPLSDQFRQRLREAELLDRIDLQLGAAKWVMRADLDDDERARFERILASFVAEHHITFPVQAHIVTAEGMLPFKIQQVITGSTPSLVTADGERLYVGDDYRGTRVVAIDQHRLSFVGKRKIEVNW
ncbi:putative lipoprotein [Janthinobacterium agaricidamnosum NBRC 102515 = DSM 9628]|uniref:Putative lipoprotein n=1 Tax=Janthinobacterium agaricidamnosum NBRC 102515 = DSM 9628 TaxID=1349767 RepID=W0V4L5_9BURK|nr:putative lipoprotein [Janthinobacterium agaricidamnosum NBRC 102515 = DSM 9628]